MYRAIGCAAAALLVTIAVQPAAADDISVCVSGTDDEAISASSPIRILLPRGAMFQPSHSPLAAK
jgi:hypothetical protein